MVYKIIVFCINLLLLAKIENDLGPPCMFSFLINSLGKNQNLKTLPTIFKKSCEENVCKISKKKKKVLSFMKLGLLFQAKDLNFLK